jgi:cellulose synthase/poly-beta-1,6-N-acetylglucosamine synthase-like glycosyltransferase/peptidoglycan/xylan/chitin deacetylase (PgdA/CDA1 family)
VADRRSRSRAAAAENQGRIARPLARWLLLAFLLLAFVVLLGAQGFSTRTTGRSATPLHGAHGGLASAGPILTWDGHRLVTRHTPGSRRIALTFDDGPDPRWTPRIAAALRRLRVPATFFVVGSEVAKHRDIVRSLHRQGFELGNHTFTHTDLAAQPAWERSLQISLTENAVAGTVGVRPRLVRPPYSSFAGAVTDPQRRAFEHLAQRGYVIALSTLDGKDWERPGADEIVRSVTPRGSSDGVVLLHDGGGDRSQTLAAIEQLVPRLRARGFRFVPLAELAGLKRDEAELLASRLERARGRLLLSTLAVARWTTFSVAILLVLVTLLFVARLLLLLVFARRHARITRGRPAGEPFTPPVSIVVPAFNEAIGIERAVRSLAASDYPDFEVVVVDDGSTDGTGDLVEQLELPRVVVVRQPNSGKPAALNRGFAAARHEVVVTADADTIFEQDTLARLVEPLRDPGVGAVSSNTKVGNRRRLLGTWQHIEYVMGFNLDRRLYDVLQCMPTVPGAAGAFRRRALDDIGGVSAATLAEDTDTTLAIGRAGWGVVYAEEARAWTEAPASLRELWRQRFRWCYGTLQAVWKHRAAFWRKGEERIGRRGLPYLVLFQILLPLLAPLIDVFAIYGLIFLDSVEILGFWLAFNALQLGLGWYAFRLDRERPWPLLAMPLQQFVYRQLMYLVVIESILSAIGGTRMHWRPIPRRGEVEVAR